ncbi:hypothetical protein EDF37_1298 [Frondihabitans sp. PhB153]|nr:hypothetical protein EDF37_1298 [Frondihabitans sp. PhB153]
MNQSFVSHALPRLGSSDWISSSTAEKADAANTTLAGRLIRTAKKRVDGNKSATLARVSIPWKGIDN